MSDGEPIASEVVKIGGELRAELERCAWVQQRDVTSLARKIVRDWLEAQSTPLRGS